MSRQLGAFPRGQSLRAVDFSQLEEERRDLMEGNYPIRRQSLNGCRRHFATRGCLRIFDDG